MTTLELTINSHAHYRHWQFSGPSCWAELTPRQAVVLMRFRERVNTQMELIFPVLDLLYGLKPSQQKWLFDERFLGRKGIDEASRTRALLGGQALIDTLDWIGQTEPGASFLVPQFTLFDFQYGSASVLLKRSWYRTVYYSPGEALGNCSFGEFMFADKAYRNKNYPLLVAILCRPASTSYTGQGDVREAFDSQTVDSRALLFEQLDTALVSLLVAQYEAALAYIQTCFGRVFPPITPEEGTKTGTKSSTSANWLDVAIGMAKFDVTKIGLIEQTNLYLALKVLDGQIQQAEEMEAEMEKMRKKK